MKHIPRISSVQGTVSAPSSKSYTNRALLLAAMSEGDTTIANALVADDSHYMLEALRKIGFTIEGTLRSEVTIGPRRTMSANEEELFIGNAGTAMRFLTGWLPFVPGRFLLTGEDRMLERPIGDLVDALEQVGAEIEYRGAEGFPPIGIRGSRMRGGFDMRISGRLSSQFVSALMMGGATLPYGVNLVIDDLVSRPYIEITRSVLEAFGAEVEWVDDGRISVRGSVQSLARYEVEGDYSSASYWFTIPAIVRGSIEVNGLRRASVQGDRLYLDVLQSLGCSVEWQGDSVQVSGHGPIRGGVFDMNAIPDIVPTLAAVAPLATDAIEITNVANLRVKESDRIAVLATELRKLGATVDERDDGLRIEPGWNEDPVVINPHADHRMAMAFAIAGLARGNVTIDDERVVGKSYPGFWTTLDRLAGQAN